MADKTKICTNCKKDVAEQNYVIHSAHCHRNIQLCSLCEEPVPVKEIDLHIEEFHTQVLCSKCKFKMERWQLEEHELSCIKRKVSCQYCEIESPYDEMDAHKSYCGSRTEQCTDCSFFVMLKDMDGHKKNKCLRISQPKIPQKPYMIPCGNCMMQVFCNEFEDHILRCRKQHYVCPKCNQQILPDEEDYHDQWCTRVPLSAVAHPGNLFPRLPPSEIRNTFGQNDSRLCANFLGYKDVASADTMPNSNPNAQNESKEMNKITVTEMWDVCPMCKIIFPTAALPGHMSVCEKASTCPLCSQKMRERIRDDHLYVCPVLQECKPFQVSSNSDCVNESHPKIENVQSKNEASAMAPSVQNLNSSSNQISGSNSLSKCPFCSESYKNSLMKKHLEVCEALKRTKESDIVTSSPFEAKIMSKKARRRQKKRNANCELRSNSGTSVANEGPASEKYELVFLPCEFCNELLPEEYIIEHQSGCRPDLVHLPNPGIVENSASTVQASPTKSLNSESETSYKGASSANSYVSSSEFPSLAESADQKAFSVCPLIFCPKSTPSQTNEKHHQKAQTGHLHDNQGSFFPATYSFNKDFENSVKYTTDTKSTNTHAPNMHEYNLKEANSRIQFLESTKSVPLRGMAEYCQNVANESVTKMRQKKYENFEPPCPKQSIARDSDEYFFQEDQNIARKFNDRQIRNQFCNANEKEDESLPMENHSKVCQHPLVLDAPNRNYNYNCPKYFQSKEFVKDEIVPSASFPVSKIEEKSAVIDAKEKNSCHLKSSTKDSEELKKITYCSNNSDSPKKNGNIENRSSEKPSCYSCPRSNNVQGENGNRLPNKPYRGRGNSNSFSSQK